MLLTEQDWDNLAPWAFSSQNKGFNPAVQESPNGDNNWDNKKVYAHIAPKYGIENPTAAIIYTRALIQAAKACKYLKLPLPGPDSTLRILHYPVGASSHSHTDFDMFTLCLYRNDTSGFVYEEIEQDKVLTSARTLFPGIHFGELANLLTVGAALKSTKHRVQSLSTVQKSIVFFCMPELDTKIHKLNCTVLEWLNERKERSRRAQ